MAKGLLQLKVREMQLLKRFSMWNDGGLKRTRRGICTCIYIYIYVYICNYTMYTMSIMCIAAFMLLQLCLRFLLFAQRFCRVCLWLTECNDCSWPHSACLGLDHNALMTQPLQPLRLTLSVKAGWRWKNGLVNPLGGPSTSFDSK